MGITVCETCGRKRPLYSAENEDGEILFLCAECFDLRAVKDDDD